MTTDFAIDAPAFRPWKAANEGPIDSFDRVLGELFGQSLMSRIVFRGDQYTRRSAIESVDDSRPQHTTDPGQISTVIEQRIHERSVRMSRPRMHDETCRFIDHDQIRVFVKHDEGNRFGRKIHFDGFRRPGFDDFTHGQTSTRTHRLPGDPNATHIDPSPHLRARDTSKLGQCHIDSCADAAFVDDELEKCRSV